ncbi:MAG: hypothetical protein AUK00_05740 [Dehalococcoidia bacterium CG2_30_46_9]|nr:MAG: hypothetical protein AUK00_05740 [Dehalococcoidia bacterium CG2_30_46_9]
MRKLSLEEFVQQAMPFLDRDLPSLVKRPLNINYVRQVMPLIQERAKTLAAVPQLANFFFLDEPQYSIELLLSHNLDATTAIQAIVVTLQKLKTIESWSAQSLEDTLRPLIVELNLSTGEFFGLLRVAITGRTAAPPLFQTMAILGKEKSLKRLSIAQQRLSP